MTAVKARPVPRTEAHRFLEETLDDLSRVPCQFFACPGPDKPTVWMATCFVCYRIKRVRVMLARLAGPA